MDWIEGSEFDEELNQMSAASFNERNEVVGQFAAQRNSAANINQFFEFFEFFEFIDCCGALAGWKPNQRHFNEFIYMLPNQSLNLIHFFLWIKWRLMDELSLFIIITVNRLHRN